MENKPHIIIERQKMEGITKLNIIVLFKADIHYL